MFAFCAPVLTLLFYKPLTKLRAGHWLLNLPGRINTAQSTFSIPLPHVSCMQLSFHITWERVTTSKSCTSASNPQSSDQVGQHPRRFSNKIPSPHSLQLPISFLFHPVHCPLDVHIPLVFWVSIPATTLQNKNSFFEDTRRNSTRAPGTTRKSIIKLVYQHTSTLMNQQKISF
jgi:hypothetical protein